MADISINELDALMLELFNSTGYRWHYRTGKGSSSDTTIIQPANYCFTSSDYRFGVCIYKVPEATEIIIGLYIMHTHEIATIFAQNISGENQEQILSEISAALNRLKHKQWFVSYNKTSELFSMQGDTFGINISGIHRHPKINSLWERFMNENYSEEDENDIASKIKEQLFNMDIWRDIGLYYPDKSLKNCGKNPTKNTNRRGSCFSILEGVDKKDLCAALILNRWKFSIAAMSISRNEVEATKYDETWTSNKILWANMGLADVEQRKCAVCNCNKTGNEIELHHIVPKGFVPNNSSNKDDYDSIKNAVPLCHVHHKTKDLHTENITRKKHKDKIILGDLELDPNKLSHEIELLPYPITSQKKRTKCA